MKKVNDMQRCKKGEEVVHIDYCTCGIIELDEDENPILFFEHKALYRSVYQDVPDNYYTIPFGKASLISEGFDISIITYGAGVHWALNEIKTHFISADLIDLRTLQPLDTDTIYKSVKKTGRVLILQEDTLFGGIASDISALINENCFEYLDAPIKIVGSENTPAIPLNENLELAYLPNASKVKDALSTLLKY